MLVMKLSKFDSFRFLLRFYLKTHACAIYLGYFSINCSFINRFYKISTYTLIKLKINTTIYML